MRKLRIIAIYRDIGVDPDCARCPILQSRCVHNKQHTGGIVLSNRNDVAAWFVINKVSPDRERRKFSDEEDDQKNTKNHSRVSGRLFRGKVILQESSSTRLRGLDAKMRR